MILDGAMGSLLMKGNNDALNISDPEAIRRIHRMYVEAGADIITTNTFSSQRISQKEYGLEDSVVEMNRQAVRIAKSVGAKMVLGDVGPTSKMLSMSEDVNDPAARSITFDELERAYIEQIGTLIDEGVDGILIETAFDTLNVKAAISAFLKVKENRNPLLFISFTISDASGRTLSGQTIEAFVTSVAHAKPYCIGMNCGLGAEAMLPYLRRLRTAISSQGLDCKVSCHPNAGLPNQFGKYDQTPEQMAEQVKPMIEEGLVDIIGGCCGTTPEHIRHLSLTISQGEGTFIGKEEAERFTVSGLESFSYGSADFITVGERCNVAGSRKFLRLINEKKYDEALEIARTQVERGAQVIDVNMDDGLLDAKQEMVTFLNMIASDPAVCRVPIMIDSSKFDVIEAGLKCCQGKCIVNSISLKQGEEQFLHQAGIIKRLGAAVIVMLFDEEGQATDYERRIHIAERAYRLLTEVAGFNPYDIIFDPNVLTIATGMEEHADYALDFIRATEWITKNLPGARISGGLSNLSFAFRGNNYLREAMHTVFLHHATKVGMNMAIMNPATKLRYEDIDEELRALITDVILNTHAQASDNLIAKASDYLDRKGTTAVAQDSVLATPEARLQKALVDGSSKGIEADLQILIDRGETPLDIISNTLMEGMTTVGRLFGEGQMFLPQVVKTARTMKQAVAFLEPFITQSSQEEKQSNLPTILIATVKGDVHDIGKNIVGVVLGCNGFNVIDLGVMVPTEKIIEQAKEKNVDFVCLSGLITPSLEEMAHVAEAMQRAGLTIPLLVGGATTSAIHTAVKIAPLYGGPVFHMRAAADNAVLCNKLMNQQLRQQVIEDNRKEQERLRLVHRQKESRLQVENREGNSKQDFLKHDWENYSPTLPPFIGEQHIEEILVSEVADFIDWTYFYWAWRVGAESEQAQMLKNDAEELIQSLISQHSSLITTQAFYPARGKHDRIEVGLTQIMMQNNYVSPLNDYIGVFAATVSAEYQAELEQLKTEDKDDYRIILMQTVGDRLVEAAAEYMSIVLKKKHGWGGIRPAVGYPMIPDQKQIFNIAKLLDLQKIGISLTENGAMYPQSSVCGVYISQGEYL